jgi:hypothetical protein
VGCPKIKVLLSSNVRAPPQTSVVSHVNCQCVIGPVDRTIPAPCAERQHFTHISLSLQNSQSANNLSLAYSLYDLSQRPYFGLLDDEPVSVLFVHTSVSDRWDCNELMPQLLRSDKSRSISMISLPMSTSPSCRYPPFRSF